MLIKSKSLYVVKFQTRPFSRRFWLKRFTVRPLILSAKFDQTNATGFQTLSSNIMSPYFPDDMLDTIKRQNDFPIHLAIFEIEATGQSEAVFTYFQNSSSSTSLLRRQLFGKNLIKCLKNVT